MPRPSKIKRVCEMPKTVLFQPFEGNNMEVVELLIEEYETFRLIDYLGFTQEDCALQMQVARTTVQAIYDNVRKKIADAIVNGKQIRITGGNYSVCSMSTKCCKKGCRKHTCVTETCGIESTKCNNCSK